MGDNYRLVHTIALVFTITMGLMVILGAMVMMYGNFDLGIILFVLGLVLVISNESILPRLRRMRNRNSRSTLEPGLLEEVANLAVIGYAPPVLVGIYLYLNGQTDFKLIVFMAVSFTVVTMKIFAKVASSRYTYRPLGGEEVYSYQTPVEETSEPGV